MTWRRAGLLLAGPAAGVLQVTVVAGLPLPGSPPDLVLLLVIAVGLVAGPLPGMLTGFSAGLLADLLGDAELGRLALVHLLAGYGAGALAGRALRPGGAARSAGRAFLVVGLLAPAALVLSAAQGLLLDDPRASLAALAAAVTTSVPYDLVLTPVVVPAVAWLLRPRPDEGGSP